MAARNLTGARVVVLGGSGELGYRIAGALAAKGARVLLAGRDADRLRARAAVVGPDTPSAVFDLRRPDHIPALFDTATALLGGIDGIVNAAGVVAFGVLADVDDTTMEELVEVDFTGPLRIMREAASRLDGGFIVNLTGVVAEQPVAGMALYSAVKAGLSAATRAVARELRRSGIDAIDIRPPHTETGLAERAVAGSAPPMKPGLDPDHVADRVVSAIESGARELGAADFGA
jgi:cyclic-di-GMP-binding biofilm dispersal mediator protein